MGSGLLQIGVLALLVVVVLPLALFGLLAALDKFERSLSVVTGSVVSGSVVAGSSDSSGDAVDEPVAVASPVSVAAEADVIDLPTPALGIGATQAAAAG